MKMQDSSILVLNNIEYIGFFYFSTPPKGKFSSWGSWFC